ncbi:MAG TPA: hypothetical protein VIH38_02215, partial [Steroidobacteraceae bacterium]
MTSVVDGEWTLIVTSVISAGAEPICDPARRSGEGTGSFVIGTQHRDAVSRQVGHELSEDFLYSLDVFEVVGMVELDVG